MNITYTPNPLNSRVDLNESERKELLYKIKLEQLKETIGYAAFLLAEKTEKTQENIQRAAQELVQLNDSFYNQEGETPENPFDNHCQQLLEAYVLALKEPHCGDCTCVPCSCIKCYVEDLLGICTIPGLGKHEACKIASLPNNATADQIITELINYDPHKKCTWGNTDAQLAARWKQEAENALAWMLNYRRQCLNPTTQ
jgi:hypothetical protein